MGAMQGTGCCSCKKHYRGGEVRLKLGQIEGTDGLKPDRLGCICVPSDFFYSESPYS